MADEMVRKVLTAEVKEVEGTERVLDFIGSTEGMDRDGEVVEVGGWELDNFKKNPVFLWAHDYYSPPIGRALDVKIDGKNLDFRIEFAPPETYEFADTIYRLYKGGFLNATSVGFIPKEWKDGQGENEPRRRFLKQELLELSGVPVPSNPQALVSARSKGVISAQELEKLSPRLKPEETENYIRIPVSAEEGQHDDHRIRTIDIDKDKGIKALYCGECKVVVTYLFDKNHDWTMQSAQAWVREHAKSYRVLGEKAYWVPGDPQIISDEIDYLKVLVLQSTITPEVRGDLYDGIREILAATGEAPSDISQTLAQQLDADARRKLAEAAGLIQSVLASPQLQSPEVSPEKLKALTLEVLREQFM